ncbi:Uncharacterised protein [Mycobacteroides abscessus]|nr:Uncharacterised protein [Mycobacteroides abscessus]CPU89215.1 Uncharacterised protein [Mycobacteroides abscessus]
MLADNGFQRPPQSTPRQLGTWFGHPGGVLSPHVGAAGAPVATDGHQQCGGAPPERLMGQSTGEAVAWDAFFAAATTPPVLVGHPARQHSTAGLKALSGHLQPKFVEAAESRQVSAGEARPTGSVRHVEVFRMRSVGTLIFERPRPLSRQRRANHLYTLICEEPENLQHSKDPVPLYIFRKIAPHRRPPARVPPPTLRVFGHGPQSRRR